MVVVVDVNVLFLFSCNACFSISCGLIAVLIDGKIVRKHLRFFCMVSAELKYHHLSNVDPE